MIRSVAVAVLFSGLVFGLTAGSDNRVTVKSGKPFSRFKLPHVTAEIAPLESCVTQDRPAAFAPIVYGDYLRAELKAGYDAHGAGSG